MTDLTRLLAHEMARLLRDGEVSSRELTELYLDRIARLDPRLNAYRVVLAEEALANAALSPATRRNIVDGASSLGEAVRSRERYAWRREAVGGSSSGSW